MVEDRVSAERQSHPEQAVRTVVENLLSATHPPIRHGVSDIAPSDNACRKEIISGKDIPRHTIIDDESRRSLLSRVLAASRKITEIPDDEPAESRVVIPPQLIKPCLKRAAIDSLPNLGRHVPHLAVHNTIKPHKIIRADGDGYNR